MSIHLNRRLAALATAIHSVASAIHSIRAPGTEGHNQATHAIDIITQLQAELSDEELNSVAGVLVKDLQADPATTVTTNPGTDTRPSEAIAMGTAPSAPADNKATPAAVEANADKHGVDLDPVAGAEGDKSSSDGKPEADKEPAKPEVGGTTTSKPTDPAKNATGAVGVRSTTST